MQTRVVFVGIGGDDGDGRKKRSDAVAVTRMHTMGYTIDGYVSKVYCNI